MQWMVGDAVTCARLRAVKFIFITTTAIIRMHYSISIFSSYLMEAECVRISLSLIIFYALNNNFEIIS